MRKLASIQKIKDISPIVCRDRIVKATIEGWSVIVSKDDFKVGDLCVFFEIDSILPNVPEFEFANKRSSHLRTMKMGGVLSQGLAITIEQAESVAKQLKHSFPKKLEVGLDLTDVLGITKWEPKEQTPRITSKKSFFERLKSFFVRPENTDFPTNLVEKTDETRVENIIDTEIQEWADKKIPFTATVKMDGSSTTWILRKKMFGGFEKIMCSRNVRITKDSEFYERYVDIRDKSKIFEVLNTIYDLANSKRIGLNESDKSKVEFVCIQAELCGPSIQGNRAKLEHNTLFAFNLIIKTGNKKYKLPPNVFDYVIDLPENDYLFIVQNVYLANANNGHLPRTIEAFYNMSTIYYDNVRNNREPAKELELLGEGLVFRNYEHGLSFKCVNPDYLMKNKE